jgi:predicted PurR-regulated permease PerM
MRLPSFKLPEWARRSPTAPDPDKSGQDASEQEADAAGEETDGPEQSGDPKLHPNVPPVVVPRWIQLVVLPLAVLALWELARAAGSVLLVLIVASLVALMLNPIVERVERLHVRRGLAIAAVYLGMIAIVAGVGTLLSNPVSDQVNKFANDVPHLTNQANHELDKVQKWLNSHGIHVHIEEQGQTALQALQKDVLKRSGDIVSFSRDLLSKVVTIGFDLVLVLVLSVYLLLYGRQIGTIVRWIMPPGDGSPEDDFPRLVQGAVSGYVRGQLLFSLIMGASTAFSLWVFSLVGIFSQGGKYAIFFGVFYGLMELIPYVGPILGAVPPVLVALFNDPITALWVVLLFVALQQLEGHVVAPQVFRISLRINPIIIILSLLIGYQLYGIIGALLALPSAAVIRQTVVYLRRHLVLEPWDVRRPPGAMADVLPLEPDRCPECGEAASGDEASCSSCGASLEPRIGTRG